MTQEADANWQPQSDFMMMSGAAAQVDLATLGPPPEPSPEERAKAFRRSPAMEAALAMRDYDPNAFMALSADTKAKVSRYSRDRSLAMEVREDELVAPLIDARAERGAMPDHGRALADLRTRLYTLEDRLTNARRMGETAIVPGLEEAVEKARAELDTYEQAMRDEDA